MCKSWIIFFSVNIPHFHYLLITWWTSRLFTLPGYFELFDHGYNHSSDFFWTFYHAIFICSDYYGICFCWWFVCYLKSHAVLSFPDWLDFPCCFDFCVDVSTPGVGLLVALLLPHRLASFIGSVYNVEEGINS